MEPWWAHLMHFWEVKPQIPAALRPRNLWLGLQRWVRGGNVESCRQWRTSKGRLSRRLPGREAGPGKPGAGENWILCFCLMHLCALASNSSGMVGVLWMSPNFSQVSLVMLQVTKFGWLLHFTVWWKENSISSSHVSGVEVLDEKGLGRCGSRRKGPSA